MLDFPEMPAYAAGKSIMILVPIMIDMVMHFA